MPTEEEDIELQPLAAGTSTTEEETPSSTRSSVDSEASRLLEEVNALGTGDPEYTDFQSDSLFVALRPAKRFKKAVIWALCLVLFIVYSAWLLSYRGTNTSTRKSQGKNSTVVESSSEVVPITTEETHTTEDPVGDLLSSLPSAVVSETPTATTTKQLVTLTELPVRPEREEIAHMDRKDGNVLDTLMFMGKRGMPKSEDEGLHFVKDGDKFVVQKLTDPKYSKLVFEGDKFNYNSKEHVIAAIVPNHDGSQALVLTDYTTRFRHSFTADYYLYDVASNTFYQITSGSDSKITHGSWSTTFRYVSFVQDNDLYIFDTTSQKVERVTTDGSDEILNGRTDWVYEEEVLESDSAIWWSQDDTQLAFLKFNESGVDELLLEKFSEGIYPTVEKLRYPKPGRVNPRLTLLKYDVQGRQLQEIDRSDSKLGEEWVCYGALWIDNALIVRESDRESKLLNYRLFKDDVSRIVYSVNSNDYNGWIENFTGMQGIPRNETAKRTTDGFVDILESEGYNHLAYFASLESDHPTMLTSGDWEVISILFFDTETNLVYFTANRQSNFERHLFAVDISSKTMYAISDISAQGFHSPVNSPGGRFIYDYNEGPSFPLIALMDTTQFVPTLPSSGEKEKRSVDFTGARRHYHTIQLSDGEYVDVIEMVPDGFNPGKKHPMLISVYGGPGFRNLNVKLHAGFEDLVTDDLNAVILYIEPRGTGGQGWKYRSYAKRHIGHWEPRDLTEVTKLWIASREYIDEDKVGIWGWSYGGFTTLKTLEFDKGQTFKYGAAVAPVTDWRMYDSIYTERYMDQPKNNVGGYKESQISDYEAFKSVKRFALMHGSGDDNVHVQNTFHLVDQLDIHGVTNFDMTVFPDSNHNINYHNAYSSLMLRLREWMKEHMLKGH